MKLKTPHRYANTYRAKPDKPAPIQVHNSMVSGERTREIMKITILNGEYGIGSCNTEDIPEWVTKLGPAKDVAFFYYQDRDWIVLNKDNVNYEFYKMIVEVYLSLDNEQKRDFKKITFETNIKVYNSLRCLNWIVRVRRNLYKSMLRKSGEHHATN